MTIDRRVFIGGAAATAAFASTTAAAAETARYGMIGKMVAKPGQRESLAAILLEDVSTMPGCLSYVIAEDPAAPDTLWITEAWESKAAHAASLALPSVKAAIGRARPLIAGMDIVAETIPLGGHGLAAANGG
jgi:quinol monooxygenase YgiN